MGGGEETKGENGNMGTTCMQCKIEEMRLSLSDNQTKEANIDENLKPNRLRTESLVYIYIYYVREPLWRCFV